MRDLGQQTAPSQYPGMKSFKLYGGLAASHLPKPWLFCLKRSSKYGHNVDMNRNMVFAVDLLPGSLE